MKGRISSSSHLTPEQPVGGGRERGDGKQLCTVFRERGFTGWCKKFFWQGQLHNDKNEELALQSLTDEMPLYKRILQYRRAIGMTLPGLFVHFFWWIFFIRKDLWYLYTSKYPMAITMVFGSIIAGMTSEGGGAIAFPVMTLALSISPSVARDFSVMIQAFGMTCASFSVLFMGIKLEWAALIFCSLGSCAGIIFGLEVVDPAMTAPQKKMFFVSIWFSFAFTLFLLNRYRKRKTFARIPHLNWWKVLVLLVTGFLGGIFTAFAGSGLDICSFSVLTLLFRVSEKVATPTSVILMAGASILSFYWRAIMMTEGPEQMAYEYLGVCIPIVVIGAPLGAILGSHFHRLVLASLVYIIDTVALVAAFALIEQTPLLAGVSVGIIVLGFAFFGFMMFCGSKLLESMAEDLLKLVDNNRLGVKLAMGVAGFGVDHDGVVLSVTNTSARAEEGKVNPALEGETTATSSVPTAL